MFSRINKIIKNNKKKNAYDIHSDSLTEVEVNCNSFIQEDFLN